MEIVTYRRVSTDKQGIKGLGMDAQQAAIQAYINQNPHVKLLAEFCEVDSGTRKGRKPQLDAAISLCEAHRATLVVAKLDRMSRNVRQIATLMESKVMNFIVLDNPHATPLYLHILAAVAEDEARRIGERTSAALQRKIARGEKVGTPANLTKEAKQKGLNVINSAKKEKAALFSQKIGLTILQLQLKKYSLNRISAHLNEQKVPTSSGKVGVWQPNKVKNALKGLNP